VWYAACYRHTRAKGETGPYPRGAALALMKAIFICLCQLAIMTRELALLTLNRCKARSSSIDVAAAEARTVHLNSCLKKSMASISKSRCAYRLVDWVPKQSRQCCEEIMSQLCVFHLSLARLCRCTTCKHCIANSCIYLC